MKNNQKAVLQNRNYEIIKCLYVHDYNEIWLVRKNGTNYVAKIGHPIEIRNEFKILKVLKHFTFTPFPVELFDVDPPFFIINFIEGDNLMNYQLIDIDEFIGLIIKLFRIVSKIHFYGIVHRDIKPTNFLKSVSDELFLIDFSVSGFRYQSRFIKCSTPNFSPKEINEGNAFVNSDVFMLIKTIQYLYKKWNFYLGRKFSLVMTNTLVEIPYKRPWAIEHFLAMCVSDEKIPPVILVCLDCGETEFVPYLQQIQQIKLHGREFTIKMGTIQQQNLQIWSNDMWKNSKKVNLLTNSVFKFEDIVIKVINNKIEDHDLKSIDFFEFWSKFGWISSIDRHIDLFTYFIYRSIRR